MAGLKSKRRRQRDHQRINADNYNGVTVGCNPPTTKQLGEKHAPVQ